MRIDVHHHFPPDPETDRKLDRILRAVVKLENDMSRMTDAVEKVRVAVEADTALDQSAITLIQGLAQQIRDTAGDPAAVEALATEIESRNVALAEAVTANTPAEPTP